MDLKKELLEFAKLLWDEGYLIIPPEEAIKVKHEKRDISDDEF